MKNTTKYSNCKFRNCKLRTRRQRKRRGILNLQINKEDEIREVGEKDEEGEGDEHPSICHKWAVVQDGWFGWGDTGDISRSETIFEIS